MKVEFSGIIESGENAAVIVFRAIGADEVPGQVRLDRSGEGKQTCTMSFATLGNHDPHAPGWFTADTGAPAEKTLPAMKDYAKRIFSEAAEALKAGGLKKFQYGTVPAGGFLTAEPILCSSFDEAWPEAPQTIEALPAGIVLVATKD